jgi:hypothetical protein
MSYIGLFADGIFCSEACRTEVFAYQGWKSLADIPAEYREWYTASTSCPHCETPKTAPGARHYYVLAKPGTSLNYLGFGARVCDTDTSVALVIECVSDDKASFGEYDHYAVWQRDRLGSGLQLAASDIFETYEDARSQVAYLALYK